jgi:hypothetical protein
MMGCTVVLPETAFSFVRIGDAAEIVSAHGGAVPEPGIHFQCPVCGIVHTPEHGQFAFAGEKGKGFPQDGTIFKGFAESNGGTGIFFHFPDGAVLQFIGVGGFMIFKQTKIGQPRMVHRITEKFTLIGFVHAFDDTGTETVKSDFQTFILNDIIAMNDGSRCT